MSYRRRISMYDRARRLLNRDVIIVLRDGREVEGVILHVNNRCLVLRICRGSVFLRVKIPLDRIREIIPAYDEE
ncbi:hypothetical protein [Paenibacillus aceti]|nr:hypothetical protein [Paenibacillus aceti]